MSQQAERLLLGRQNHRNPMPNDAIRGFGFELVQTFPRLLTWTLALYTQQRQARFGTYFPRRPLAASSASNKVPC
eukprot:11180490-Lingulodinium_polyedra.AAC.1